MPIAFWDPNSFTSAERLMQKELLGQRYRLIDRIGEGGMAYVYLAVDEKLGRKVAVKVLHSHMEKNPDIRKRFQLEAQAISSLDHPNIVKIYDFSGDQSEKLWIVTEVITGSNLADYLAQQRDNRLHMIVATCIVREITKALTRAHAQKIVHRDIKPENVMLTLDGRIKLMDFGIAKDMQHTGMTMTGTFMGSPSYMSPEQIRGKDIDFKTDIYSVAVLYYEILTGRLPFVGKTTHDVVMRIMEGVYTFPRFIISDILPEIDQEIIRAMSMDPKKRHESIEEFGFLLDSTLKKAGFDESHIELERYTKNPQDYLKGIAQKAKSSETSSNQNAQTPIVHRGRRKTDYHQTPAGTIRKGTSYDQEKTQLLGDQRIFSPRLPGKSAQNTPLLPPSPQIEAKSPRSTARAEAKEATSTRPAPRKNTEYLPERDGIKDSLKDGSKEAFNREYPRDKAAAKKTEIILDQEPPSFPRQAPRPPMMPPPATVRVVPAEALHPQRQPAPRVQHQIPLPPVRRKHIAQIRNYQPVFLPYFFGFLWVGLIIFLSSWGFLELNKYLSGFSPRGQSLVQGEKRSKQSSKEKQTKQESEAPVDIFKPTGASGTTGPSSLTGGGAKSPRTNDSKDKRIERNLAKNSPGELFVETSRPKQPQKQTKVRVIKQLPSQEKNGLFIETNIIRQKKTKKPPMTKVALSPRQPLSSKKTSEPMNDSFSEKRALPTQPSVPKEDSTDIGNGPPISPPEKQVSTGKSRVQVSSQPAAEVYIDEIKVGNTNDSTSSSGWIIISPGQHVLELKRQGYLTHRMNFEVGDDAQLNIPKIDLKPSFTPAVDPSPSSERRGNFVLTVKVSHTPSTLLIRNLETNNLQTVVLKSQSRAFSLEPSRYHVRVEHGGQSHERTFNTKTTPGNYTFFADF